MFFGGRSPTRQPQNAFAKQTLERGELKTSSPRSETVENKCNIKRIASGRCTDLVVICLGKRNIENIVRESFQQYDIEFFVGNISVKNNKKNLLVIDSASLSSDRKTLVRVMKNKSHPSHGATPVNSNSYRLLPVWLHSFWHSTFNAPAKRRIKRKIIRNRLRQNDVIQGENPNKKP